MDKKNIIILLLTVLTAAVLMILVVLGVMKKDLDNDYQESGSDIYEYENESPTEVTDMNFSFDEIKTMFSQDATEEEIKEAEELFFKATQLDKEGKSKEASETWEKFFSLRILASGMSTEVDMTLDSFEDLKEMISDDASEEQLQEAKKIFDEAKAFEKAEDYENANKKFDQLFKLEIFKNVFSQMEQ